MAFSFFPIRAISILVILLGLSALFYGIYIAVLRVLGDIQVEGWTALMVVMLFVAAFQMIALGIIGEYVWRGLDAARKRPLYVVPQVYKQK